MKKKLAALILTLVMACSFCMTSCNLEAAAYHASYIPKVGRLAIQNTLLALFTSQFDNWKNPDKERMLDKSDIQAAQFELRNGNVVATKLAK